MRNKIDTERKILVSLFLSRETFHQLVKAATEAGKTLSEAVEELLRDALR
jgi:hypothetical protein